MNECSTPITRAMVERELDIEHVIENTYQMAINITDEIYGNPEMIIQEYDKELHSELFKERHAFLIATVKFIYETTLK